MERSTRPQRNRRHSKRAWPPEEDDAQHMRPAKMLFTPEIKRYLKDWLVRRRDNPYPTRDEKKRLAVETGLTYTQICNWFANWRRKLKNSEREKAKQSWGHLIKNYNTKAKGNVEQFSISSADSIWEEERMMDRQSDDDELESHDEYSSGSYVERSGGSDGNYSWTETVVLRPNFYVDSAVELGSSYTPNGRMTGSVSNTLVGNRLPNSQPKYKQQMMEKYLRDTTNSVEAPCFMQHNHTLASYPAPDSGTELNKWLVSAARFTPNKNNYHIEWNTRRQKHETVDPTGIVYNVVHQKDELDAAEALANLAFNCRRRLLTSVTHPVQHVISS